MRRRQTKVCETPNALGLSSLCRSVVARHLVTIHDDAAITILAVCQHELAPRRLMAATRRVGPPASTAKPPSPVGGLSRTRRPPRSSQRDNRTAAAPRARRQGARDLTGCIGAGSQGGAHPTQAPARAAHQSTGGVDERRPVARPSRPRRARDRPRRARRTTTARAAHRHCFTEPEVDALLDACDQTTWTGRRNHAMFVLTIHAGPQALTRAAGAQRLAPLIP